MDDFESNYFQKLNQFSAEYKEKRRELAISRIRLFSAAVARQLEEEKQKFDLVIGAGNSGLFMTHIVKLVYRLNGLALPPVAVIPLHRIIQKDRPAEAVYTIPDNLHQIRPVKNVLFVDDEIMRGVTAKTCLEILRTINPGEEITCTIIAENHFFEWHYRLPQVSIAYFAYARLIQGLNGNIGGFVPQGLIEKIKAVFPEVAAGNHLLALITGGAIKKIYGSEPYFDNRLAGRIEKTIPEFYTQKQKLLEELDTFVREALNDYRDGKIHFRF